VHAPQSSTLRKKLISLTTKDKISISINGTAEISATASKHYWIGNLDLWFCEACKDTTARKWLEESMAAGDSYLMVGYRSVVDASVTANRPDSSAAAGMNHVRTYISSCEQVYAIQYRKIHFKWLSSRDVECATLDNSRWKVMWGVRAGDNDGTDDDVDASLGEVVECDDEYLEDLQKFVAKDETCYFLDD
jgi:hypothetical protein